MKHPKSSKANEAPEPSVAPIEPVYEVMMSPTEIPARTPAPEPEPAPAFEEYEATTLAAYLNNRVAPEMGADIITILSGGTRVTVDDERDGWAHFKGLGWSMKEFIRKA